MGGRCKATTKSGRPCRAHPITGSDFCALHSDPEKAAELGRKGGKMFAPLRTLPEASYSLDTPQAVAVCLGDTINAVLTGRLDHRVGNSVAVLCGQLTKALEQGDLEQRIAALEERLPGGKGR
jgi:general stress protein YciG